MSLDSASDELRETFKRALRRFPRRCRSSPGRPGSPARDDGDRRDIAVARSSSLIVCINQATLLHDIMLLARRFCVNVLRRDQVPSSSAFSGALPAEERFGLGDWMTRPRASPTSPTRRSTSSARRRPPCPTARTRSSSAKPRP